MIDMNDLLRPRFGVWIRGDGAEVPVVFHPERDMPGQFRPHRADDETPVVAQAGDKFRVDVIDVGQSIGVGIDIGSGLTGVLNLTCHCGQTHHDVLLPMPSVDAVDDLLAESQLNEVIIRSSRKVMSVLFALAVAVAIQIVISAVVLAVLIKL